MCPSTHPSTHPPIFPPTNLSTHPSQGESAVGRLGQRAGLHTVEKSKVSYL
jgi:hypothetical protein